nr:signal peptidase II [Planosporangium thailandense]
MGQTTPSGGEAATPVPGASARSRRPIAVLALASAVVLGIDLVTKQLAVSELAGREPVRLFGGAVYLDVIRNSGAAFSLGTGYTFVFPVIAMAVAAWIVWTARRLRSVPWAIALGLVLGGAVGNLVDRIFRAPGPMVGHVVDMVSLFAPRGEVFAVFNAADSALCVGVALALLLELTGRRVDGTRTRDRDQAAVSDSARG